MHLLIAGASGFLGTRLREQLTTRGHDVTALVRRPAGPGEAEWDPYLPQLDPDVVEQADVVVNLAGSPTLGNPHSAKWAEQLMHSRVTSTRVLAEAIAVSERKPAFLAGNGISFYGDHGTLPVTEASDSRGDALLTRVARAWQEAAEPARIAGARVCVLRTSPVMDVRSEPLKAQRLQFKAGLGGRLGSGKQSMPIISTRDWVDAVVHLAESERAAGPFNLCCERAPTNAEFTSTLAALVGRPAVLNVPRFVLARAAGQMAPELLGSVNPVPAALLADGFRFSDPDVSAVLREGLAPSR